MRGLVALLLVAVALAGCSQDAEPTAAPDPKQVSQPGILRGVVVDVAVAPLADVRVVAEPGGNATFTDVDGAFAFTALEPGTYSLTATKEGYLDTTIVASVLEDRAAPVAKITMDADPESFDPYVNAYHYQGFVECAIFPINWCGQINIASLILCEGYGVCLGDITTDRSLALHWLDGVPDFLQTEMVWEAGNSLGENFFFVIGGGTREEIASGFVTAQNTTRGPSPLMMQLHNATLKELSIGGDRAMMTQVHPSPQEDIPGGCVFYNPCGPSVHVAQDFEYFTHTFFGYEPPNEWLFAVDGAPPGPPGG